MTLYTRRKVMALTAAGCFLPAYGAHAQTPRVASNGASIALDGYDTTAYWQISRAQRGTQLHVAQWRAVRWQFATQARAELFDADPLAFATQFGGFCTRAMSFGKWVNGDPEVWRIHDAKLYLFAQPVGGEKFDEGQEAMIAKAQGHWDAPS